jgi:hypothetical protein
MGADHLMGSALETTTDDSSTSRMTVKRTTLSMTSPEECSADFPGTRGQQYCKFRFAQDYGPNTVLLLLNPNKNSRQGEAETLRGNVPVN